jgi:hypothetical protein
MGKDTFPGSIESTGATLRVIRVAIMVLVVVHDMVNNYQDYNANRRERKRYHHADDVLFDDQGR